MRKFVYFLCSMGICALLIARPCCCVFAQAPAIQWQRSYGGFADDQATCVKHTTDGGYIVAGFSYSDSGDVTGNHGGYDCWVIKISATGTLQWQKTYGGSNDDEAYSINQTADGGYIMAGISTSNDGDVSGNHGGYDCWVVKINDTGNIEWQKSLGGSSDDDAFSCGQTADGGYIVAGWSNSTNGDVTGNHGLSDVWVVKLSAAGNIQWQKSLGGTRDESAQSISQTLDGGYIVAGFSTSNNGDVSMNHGGLDYWIVKLNDTGGIVWQQSLGGTGKDIATSVQQTADSGYIVSGNTFSSDGDVTGNHGNSDYWLVKLTAAGAMQWQKTLGGSGDDEATCMAQTSDGGYLVTGYSASNDGDVTGNHGNFDYWTVKLSAAASILWEKSSGGLNSDKAFATAFSSDSGFVVAGYSSSSDGDVTTNKGSNDFWVVKYNTATATSTIPASGNITITPNPANSTVYVLGANASSICIYNSLGQLIKVNSNTNHISLSEFPDGIYFIGVCDELHTLLKLEKIVKINGISK